VALNTQAQTGERVCIFGTTSGQRCGTITSLTPTSGVINETLSAPGDSGGPAIRCPDHSLVGIVIGHTDGNRTLFEPITNIAALAAHDEQIDGLAPVVN
jgi:hypothetical protein